MISRLLTLLVCLICISCGGPASFEGGTETGNPQKVDIGILGYQSSTFQNLAFPQLITGNLQVDSAEIVFGRLQFRPFDNCELELENEDISFDGPFIVDLADLNNTDILEGVDVPSGTYCKIKLRIEKLVNDPSHPLFEQSILIKGVRNDGTAFQVTLDKDEELELENTVSGFDIGDTNLLQRFFIAFDIDHWFQDVDLNDSEVEISTGPYNTPIILIEEGTNQEILETIIENIKLSSNLFEDSNDDNELDQEEHDTPLAEGTSIP